MNVRKCAAALFAAAFTAVGVMAASAEVFIAPTDTVTVSDAAALAGKLLAYYNSASLAGTAKDDYVSYAVSSGAVDSNVVSEPDEAITRGEFARLLDSALPDSFFNKINDVESVPDINMKSESELYEKVLRLYNAGILMGSDDYGTFNEGESLKRYELDIIAERLANPESRIKGEPKKTPLPDAYQFIYVDNYSNSLIFNTSTVDNLPSGWVLDNRGGTPMMSIEDSANTLVDISKTQGTALIRPFNEISEGKVTAEFSLKIDGDGGYFEFRDKDDNTSYLIKFIDGAWKRLDEDGNYVSVYEYGNLSSSVSFKFRLFIDIDEKTAHIYINDTDGGTSDLLSDRIAEFRFATDREHTLSLEPGILNMVANYGVFEDFDTFGLEDVYGWSDKNGASVNSDGELVLEGTNSTARKTFDAIPNKYIASTYFILPTGQNISFSVMSGDASAVTVSSSGGKLYANGSELYTLTQNMWYRLRIEANPGTGKANVLLNGRSVGEVVLGTDAPIDSLYFTSASGSPKFDYIRAYGVVDHPDYVPEPSTAARFDDYTVLVNVCSLWRNDGASYGWAPISPFDENKPLLGYYDEGLPETADWEIKQMVEHGIDVQAFCWFNDNSNGPIKHPKHSDQLHEGYMYSKYSDYMKYVLLYEFRSGEKIQLTPFKRYLIPYLFENYFLDDRYLKIDNKIVIHTFGGDRTQFDEWYYFGDNTSGSGEAGAKEAFKALDDAAKSYGYDGIIVLANNYIGYTYDDWFYADGVAAYNWGVNSYSYDINVNNNLNNYNAGKTSATPFYNVPVISAGYNRVAWSNLRSPMMSVSDFKKSNDWVKNTYIPRYARTGDWTRNLVLISTWNEFGEGTYIAPSGLNGYGYLDVLRDDYTDLPEQHEDDVLTDAQLSRIGHMYPSDFRVLARLRADEDITNAVPTVDVKFSQDLNRYTSYLDAGGISKGYSTSQISGTASTRYPYYRKRSINQKIDDITYIKVTASLPVGSWLYLYFTTTTDTVENEAKRFSVQVVSSNMRDYYVATSGNDYWHGTLSSLRIGCHECEIGDTFAVKNFSLCTDKAKNPYAYTLTANTVPIKSGVDYDVINGKVLFPYDPQTAIHLIMHTYMRWDKDGGVLSIEGNDHKVVYTVGSDKYTVDGAETDLGYTMYLKDGLPMVDFEDLASKLGYTSSRDARNIQLRTPEYNIYNAITTRKEGAWEFNEYDTEGWTSTNMKLTVKDGYMHAECSDSGTNPVIFYKDTKFSSKQYAAFEIRIRYNYTAWKKLPWTLYFLTAPGQSYTQTRAISDDLRSYSTGSNWETYTVKLEDVEGWDGTIYGMRFDPFDANGYMDIDYIRFITDEEYEQALKDAEANKNLVLNGNAELEGVMFHSYDDTNSTITIETDSADSSNRVYRVTGNPDKKVWAYIIQELIEDVEDGEEVRISYDVRALPDSAGNKVNVTVTSNMRYATKGVTSRDHNMVAKVLPADGSWVHVETIYTFIDIDTTSTFSPAFSLYANPNGDNSSCFEVDNVIVRSTKAVSSNPYGDKDLDASLLD